MIIPAIKSSKQEIWVFRVGSLGDALVTLPAVHHLKKLYPQAELVLLTNHGAQSVVYSWEVFKNSGVFTDHLSYHQRTVRDVVWLIWQMWRRRPVKLFYLAPHRSPLQVRRDRFFFSKLGGIAEVYGLDKDHNRSRQEVSTGVTQKEAERLLKIVDPAAKLEGVAGGELLQVSEGDFQTADMLLSQAGCYPGTPLVVMVPGSKMQSKRWPAERFLEVSRWLLQKHDHMMIALLGSKDEAPLCQSMAQELGSRVISLAGRTSIMEAAAVLARSVVYVGNDTGTMHLAAAMRVPCVAIFSARDAAGKWEPFGSNSKILRANVPCAGCMLEKCIEHKNLCLTEISAQEVIDAVAESLGMRNTVSDSKTDSVAVTHSVA